MTQNFDAKTALDAARDTRGHFADNLRTPGWYTPVCGVLLAAICLVLGLPAGTLDRPLRPVLVLLALLGLLVNAQLYRRTTGAWIQGTAGPRTRKLLVGCAVGVVAAIWVSVANDLWHGPWWMPFLVAAMVVVGATAFGRHYDSTWRAELRSGASQ